jgi:hypothetical protein
MSKYEIKALHRLGEWRPKGCEPLQTTYSHREDQSKLELRSILMESIERMATKQDTNPFSLSVPKQSDKTDSEMGKCDEKQESDNQ